MHKYHIKFHKVNTIVTITLLKKKHYYILRRCPSVPFLSWLSSASKQWYLLSFPRIVIKFFLFWAVLGLHCCVQSFPSCAQRGLLSSCGACGCHHSGCPCCSMRTRGQAQQLWCMGSVALWPVGSSGTRDWTITTFIARQILNHCTTREVPELWDFLAKFFWVVCFFLIAFSGLFVEYWVSPYLW